MRSKIFPLVLVLTFVSLTSSSNLPCEFKDAKINGKFFFSCVIENSSELENFANESTLNAPKTTKVTTESASTTTSNLKFTTTEGGETTGMDSSTIVEEISELATEKGISDSSPSSLEITKTTTMLSTLNIPPSIPPQPIEALSIKNSPMKLFITSPNFPSIKGLLIENSNLSKITQRDLQNFPFLTHLRLAGNELEILEKNLFDNLTTLESISIDELNVLHMDSRIFMKISKIFYLDLKFGECNTTLTVGNPNGTAEEVKVEMRKSLKRITEKKVCFNSSVHEILLITAIGNENKKFIEKVSEYESIETATEIMLERYRKALRECKEKEKMFTPAAWILMMFFGLTVLSLGYELRKLVRKEKIRGGESLDMLESDDEK